MYCMLCVANMHIISKNLYLCNDFLPVRVCQDMSQTNKTIQTFSNYRNNIVN